MEPTSRFGLDIKVDESADHDELVLEFRNYLVQQPDVVRAEPIQVQLPAPETATRAGVIELVTLGVTITGTLLQAIAMIQGWLAHRASTPAKSVRITVDGRSVEIVRVPTDANMSAIEDFIREHTEHTKP